jgi:hypothetical protein
VSITLLFNGLGFLRSAAKALFCNYDSNSLLEMPDCRIIDCSVPIRNSAWLGTGTVIVVSGRCFCITIWLPRCRISSNPCRERIAQTCFPERI